MTHTLGPRSGGSDIKAKQCLSLYFLHMIQYCLKPNPVLWSGDARGWP